MRLPLPRGPVSASLFDLIRGPTDPATPAVGPSTERSDDPLADDDLQLALWCCYELHYRGFDDVAPEWEWEPGVLVFRRALETAVLDALRDTVAVPTGSGSIAERLQALVAADDGPPLSRYLQRQATRPQYEEFAIHRSIYHLKEADPHSWGIPRLRGRAKAALVEIQADEYGGGVAARMHSELFRATLRGLGLADEYGYYLDDVPGTTLAISNLISLFGLHREWRGALVGHLAAFEMTSSVPNRRYSLGLRRLGLDDVTRRFYDEHVTADALHEQLAAHDLCGGLVEDEPQLADDILFGATCCLELDNRFAAYVLTRWQSGRSSLRSPALTAGAVAAAQPS
jgi:Iron-containing redox enzyme